MAPITELVLITGKKRQACKSMRSRRDVLKLLVAIPMLDAGIGSQQRGGRQRPQVEGVVTQSPTAVPGGKPLLTLYSISLQWADYDEAADTAAKAGWPAIGWTVRGGGHVLPENVVRDLPKAVEAAKKAGLKVPIIITPVRDGDYQYAE